MAKLSTSGGDEKQYAIVLARLGVAWFLGQIKLCAHNYRK